MYFVVANDNKNINIYDASTYQMIHTYTNMKTPTSVKFSKNSLYIGIAFDDPDVVILDGSPPFGLNKIISTGFSGGNP